MNTYENVIQEMQKHKNHKRRGVSMDQNNTTVNYINKDKRKSSGESNDDDAVKREDTDDGSTPH